MTIVSELPATEWLGYSIDLSRSPTMDLRAASASVIKIRRIIDFNTDENLLKVKINGTTYDVPSVVRVAEESRSQSNFLSYSTGSDARKAFSANSELPSRYFAITGTDPTMVLAQDRPFIRQNQYAFYSFSNSAYTARLMNYHPLLNDKALLRGVEELPSQFTGDNQAVLEAYKSFFQRFGSHVIVNASYGARFQLNAWASNADASVNAKFNTDLKAYFGGIPDGGQYEANVKSEPQYKVFFEYMQSLVTVFGGDGQLSSNLTSKPNNWETYKKWSNSVQAGDPRHISFHTTAIWSLMSASSHGILRSYAGELNQAFTWILTHPRVYKTVVTFDVLSTWAAFNLLSPNAIIIHDRADPFPPGTIASYSHVQWETEQNKSPGKKTLRFFIINDGSPVDFSISHGNDGAAPGQGRAEAFIEGKRYLNDKITGDTWNTEWFFSKPVTVLADPLPFRKRSDKYSWHDVLSEYLDTIKEARA